MQNWNLKHEQIKEYIFIYKKISYRENYPSLLYLP